MDYDMDYDISPFDDDRCTQCSSSTTLHNCCVCQKLVCHFCSDSACYMVFNPMECSYYIIGINHIDVEISDHDIKIWEKVYFLCSQECFNIHTAFLDFVFDF